MTRESAPIDGPPRAAPPGAWRSAGSWTASASNALDWLSGVWIWVVVVGLAVFLGLAVLAPILDIAGLHGPASAVYLLYRAACHQLPQRSYFLGGQSLTYGWDTVQAHYGLTDAEYWTAFHRPIRDPVLGYQVAMCQRDVAIFGAMLVASVAIAAAMRRRPVRSVPMRYLVLATIPAAVDGVSQLLGLRESTPLIRTATGALFGVAVAVVILPMLQSGFETGSGDAAARSAVQGRSLAEAPPLPAETGRAGANRAARDDAD